MIKIDLEEVIFAIGIVIALILFVGEPDLADRIMYGELPYQCIPEKVDE